MKNICFYNHWHNGDVFAGKGWIQAIQKQANVSFAYAHGNHEKVVKDLGMEHLSCEDLPEGLIDKIKVADTDDEIFINTWIGSYGWEVIPRGEDHANWQSLHRMYTAIVQYINNQNKSEIRLSDDPLDFVASTDWSAYRTDLADQYIEKTKANQFHLICNGLVRSTQSNIGTMKGIIEQLARDHSMDVFVCTAKFETDLPNIQFTDDIFGLDCDLNEIAYLSTKCATIVGKNSGPYMFCHVKDNIFNENKAFVSLSHRPSDCYPYNTPGLSCHYYHCSSDDEAQVTQAIETAIQSLGTKGPGHVVILDK